MKALLIELKAKTLDQFKMIWTTKIGIVSLLITLAAVFCIASVVTGEMRNPLWMVWWALCGSLTFCGSSAAYQMYMNKLSNQLEQNINNPPGFKYSVTTSDGATIGEIDELVYLKAKFEADTCLSTKALQAFNTIWVLWSLVVRALVFMPVLLVTAALTCRLFFPDTDLSEITLGQVLESNLLVMLFQFTLIITVVASFIGGTKSIPGYKNYRELRLRRILSIGLPNIANANGFTIIGYKTGMQVANSNSV